MNFSSFFLLPSCQKVVIIERKWHDAKFWILHLVFLKSSPIHFTTNGWKKSKKNLVQCREWICLVNSVIRTSGKLSLDVFWIFRSKPKKSQQPFFTQEWMLKRPHLGVSCQLPFFGFTSCQDTSRHLTCFKTDLMDNWPLLISYLMLSDLLPSLPFWPLTFWQLAFIHKWPFWQITFSQFTCLDVLPFDSLPVLSIYLFDN